MDRRDLEMIDAIAAAGTLSAAAGELRVAQPALSRRLRRVERELGAPLFVRGRHGAAPTPAGRVVVEGCRVALAALRRADADARDAAAGRLGRLRIGTTPTLGADLLPAVLADMRAARPEVSLDLLASGDSDRLRDDVRQGVLDVALVAASPADTDRLRVAAEGLQPFVLVVPGDWDSAALEVVPRRDIAELPLIALARGEGLRLVVEAVFGELGAEPDIAIETTEREMLVPFVSAGLGATLLPQVFAEHRRTPGVAILALDPPFVRTVRAVVRPEPLPLVSRDFVDVLSRRLAG
ncbi:MAG: Hydrogen peroxide-inducible genes activator [Acidimicrobiales bacterium]|nr:MAG: LysR family transcriptional regulator [Actinomycetota bacterium]MBV6508853.1 Hydrogen peroxide-inducible genes activator [Acidimicrobiales bacterium]RIK04979.1 MAG: hypothetical protein DCC48_11550 [Acidobacteriota bacterium]